MADKPYRVGAILSAHDGVVSFLGYGNLLGDFPYPGTFMGMTGFDNPKIELDNGDIVWGCECWWRPEEHCAVLNAMEGK